VTIVIAVTKFTHGAWFVCPDRRLTRTVTEVVAEELADGQTEVTVLVPRTRARVAGRVRSLRIRPWAVAPSEPAT